MLHYYKLKLLLTRSEQWQMLLLFFMVLISMVLETMGLGLVLSSIAIMTKSDITQNYAFLEPVLKFFNYPNQIQLIIGGVIALFAIYCVKTGFLILMNWKKNKFIYGVEANLSHRLFEGYIRQPWAFHLQRNSAQLIYNITSEVSLFSSNALFSSLSVLTEGFIFIGISFLLFISEPIGTVVILSLLGIIAFSFNRLLRARITRWGKSRQQYDGYRLQYLQQGLGGVKDAKILGRENDFIYQFNKRNRGLIEINQKLNTLMEIPRLVLELLAVMGLIGMVFTMLIQGKPVETLIPTLGLFAVAAFRLIPSVNRMMTSFQNVRYSAPSINRLYNEMILIMDSKVFPKKELLSFKHDIVLDQVSHRYENANSLVLKNISLIIPRGVSVGFVGESGAGKSTLVDIILGLLTPQTGSIRVDNIDIQTQLRGWQDQIGYVPQAIFLTDDTFRRNVAFGLPDEEIDDAAVLRAIKAAQLYAFVDNLPEGINTFVGERGVRLSGGQRQRIGIARALYHDPSVLVLDEATSSLDSATEAGVMKDINALHGEKTLIIVAHRVSTLENCDVIYRLENGKIVDQGAFNDVIKKNTQKEILRVQ